MTDVKKFSPLSATFLPDFYASISPSPSTSPSLPVSSSHSRVNWVTHYHKRKKMKIASPFKLHVLPFSEILSIIIIGEFFFLNYLIVLLKTPFTYINPPILSGLFSFISLIKADITISLPISLPFQNFCAFYLICFPNYNVQIGPYFIFFQDF